MTDFAPCPLCESDSLFDMTGTDLMFGGDEEFEYRRCRSCSAVFQHPMPPLEKIATFYKDGYAPHVGKPKSRIGDCERAVLRLRYGYTELTSSVWARLIAPLLACIRYRDSISANHGGRAVDVGCGRGGLVAKLSEMGWQSEGVEFDAGAVAVARQAELEVFHGELSEAGFPDDTFDLVTTQHVIEHLADPNAFMQEVRRVLKPGGCFYAKTPNARALGRKWYGRFWFHNDVPRHLVLFTKASLSDLARRHSFEAISIHDFAGPKAVLNSHDWRVGLSGKPSRHRWGRRILGKIFALCARALGKGDVLLLRCRLHSNKRLSGVQ